MIVHVSVVLKRTNVVGMSLKMTSDQVVKTLVDVNKDSSFQNCTHPGNHTRQTKVPYLYIVPGQFGSSTFFVQDHRYTIFGLSLQSTVSKTGSNTLISDLSLSRSCNDFKQVFPGTSNHQLPL